jgi:DNA modification methylase
MKPIRLIGRQINNSTKPREIVLDPFGGSGSTLIAAEQLNRSCYMMELDPRYADVIIKRYEDLTGDKVRIIKKGGTKK